MSEKLRRGILGSERIPVPEGDEIDAGYCLRLLRQLRDASFATVTDEGLPSIRIIDVMHVEGGRLYFLTARGKAFYDELMYKPYVAMVSMTCDLRMVRLEGWVEHPTDAAEQRRLVDWMFELNPEMERLYEVDSRYVLEVFFVERGHGEYYDLGQKPVVRVSYSIGEDDCDSFEGRFVITDGCTGCGTCADICPQHCISRGTNGKCAIEQSACLGCGLCSEECPAGAIEKRDSHDEDR